MADIPIAYIGYSKQFDECAVRFAIRGVRYEYILDCLDAEYIDKRAKYAPGKMLNLAKKRARRFNKVASGPMAMAREMVCVARLLIGGKPSGAEIAKLVEAYALKLYSARYDAPIRVQQKLHDAFERRHGAMESKYPEYDMRSSAFWSAIENGAERWWSKQAMKGPGTHW